MAVAARGRQKAEDFAKKFNIETVYEGYDGLATDKNIDIIYIGKYSHIDFHLVFLKIYNIS